MILLDANVLLYAYNADAPQQRAAAQWLTGILKTGEPIGLPAPTIWAFLRISTNLRVWPNPLSGEQAFGIIGEWVAHPATTVIVPGPSHLDLLRKLATEFHATGPLLSDAVLAALALEYGAAVASTDQDFRRFPTVRWINPLKP